MVAVMARAAAGEMAKAAATGATAAITAGTPMSGAAPIVAPAVGHAYGHDIGRGGQAGGANVYHDLNEFVDSVRSGKAVGLEHRDERIDQARGPLWAALEKANRDKHAGYGLNSNNEIGPAAHHFSPEETKALLERGWKGPAARTAGFRNHGSAGADHDGRAVEAARLRRPRRRAAGELRYAV
jgi:hypothetical protein